MLIEPLTAAVDAEVGVPGSKSITNRALVCAALAAGESTLRGVLRADDTDAMLGAIAELGAQVENRDDTTVHIVGTGGQLASGPIDIDVRLSGTTTRFVTPLAARGSGPYRIDGAPEMRARPMAETVQALRELQVDVVAEGPEGAEVLPLTVKGPLAGGELSVAADVSSQFASGLLLAGPGTERGIGVVLDGAVVSRPYIEMTCEVMRAFGANVTVDANRFIVPSGTAYQATDYQIEPDASAASYFFAAAAVTGGRVKISGLGTRSLQGDVDFVDVLAQMGAHVTKGDDFIEVQGSTPLHGIEIDMSDISDTAQTLAAIAPFAEGATRVTGIGFIRKKETDRVGAVVAELQRMGVDAIEENDGFLINPSPPQPAQIQTYSDHRMAMSFAITGLMAPGIEIMNPSCVDKTFPGYWDTLATLYS